VGADAGSRSVRPCRDGPRCATSSSTASRTPSRSMRGWTPGSSSTRRGVPGPARSRTGSERVHLVPPTSGPEPVVPFAVEVLHQDAAHRRGRQAPLPGHDPERHARPRVGTGQVARLPGPARAHAGAPARPPHRGSAGPHHAARVPRRVRQPLPDPRRWRRPTRRWRRSTRPSSSRVASPAGSRSIGAACRPRWSPENRTLRPWSRWSRRAAGRAVPVDARRRGRPTSCAYRWPPWDCRSWATRSTPPSWTSNRDDFTAPLQLVARPPLHDPVDQTPRDYTSRFALEWPKAAR
jgi:hypothetical protein